MFSPPSHAEMLAVSEAVSGGAGVLYLYGNYGGDTMNFDLAAELAADQAVQVATLLGADDVASAPKGSEADRRGGAGIVFLYKIAGAKADEGASLEEVVAVTAHAASRVRSMGVALSPCTVPAAGQPTFTVAEGEMELGMGIHGEPGTRSRPLETADQIAGELVSALLEDLPYEPGEPAAVLVNGLGAAPREELYILYRKVHELLGKAGVSVERAFVGEYATSLEMAGASLSLLNLDDELNRLDAAAGDGDLGNTVTLAAQAVRASIRADREASPAALLRRCGTDVATSAPSTSGTLTARALLAAGRAADSAARASLRSR